MRERSGNCLTLVCKVVMGRQSLQDGNIILYGYAPHEKIAQADACYPGHDGKPGRGNKDC